MSRVGPFGLLRMFGPMGMLYLYWALAAVLPAAAAVGVLALADALWGVG